MRLIAPLFMSVLDYVYMHASLQWLHMLDCLESAGERLKSEGAGV